MTGENEPREIEAGNADLARIKAGLSPEGGNFEIAIGAGMPRALARFFPRRSMKTVVDVAITEVIVEKIRSGAGFSPAEAEFAEHALSDATQRYVRRMQIMARAAEAHSALPEHQRLLGTGTTEPSFEQTAEDWVNKFWADAELVSDELLQEVYARILVRESLDPGACSLTTLRVLRYLDPRIGGIFSAMLPAVCDSLWVPRDDSILAELGVTFASLLELEEAGLAQTGGGLLHVAHQDLQVRFIKNGTRVLSYKRHDGEAFRDEIDVYPLTRAGRELHRVATVERPLELFVSIARYLTKSRSPEHFLIQWADLPTAEYKGPADALEWQDLPSD
jgi:hypothetical protein